MTARADTCRRLAVPRLQAAGWKDKPHSVAVQQRFTTPHPYITDLEERCAFSFASNEDSLGPGCRISHLAKREVEFPQLVEQAGKPDADPFGLLHHLAFNALVTTRLASSSWAANGQESIDSAVPVTPSGIVIPTPQVLPGFVPKVEAHRKRQLVILVHGIRTRAEWQGRIRHLLEAEGQRIVEPVGYEYFDVLRFLSPFWTRRKPIRVVLEKIRDALNLHNGKFDELIIVAHSFGTFIIGTILRENPDIKPARLLLCGCVLPGTYAWDKLPNRPKSVLNEAGSRDIWPILAKSITWGFGSTGTFGFQTPGVRDRYHKLAHSDYFKPGFAEEYWVPWIRDEERKPTTYETGERPPTPFYKNLLDILPLKYVLLSMCILIMLVCVQLRPSSRIGTAVPERNSVSKRPVLEATLVVDSVASNEVRYHFSIKNTGSVAANAIRFSEKSSHMTAAEFQPPPFSQLMPGGTMSHGIPIGIKLDSSALTHDLTIQYQSSAGNEEHFQSSYRFWVLRELLKPGEFACIGANHDGTVPDAFDKSTIQKILDQIAASAAPQQGEQGLPGLSLLTLVRISTPLDDRRQCLFEFGEPGKASFAVYVAPGKIFTIVFIDAKSEPYPIKVPFGDGGVPLGEFAYLACQIGVADRTTMLRLSVNGKTIQTLNLPFKADLGALNFKTGIIGADLTKHNGAAFDLCELVGYTCTLTELQVNRLSPYFLDQPHHDYLEFNGKQWMQRDEKGNMVQAEIALAPTFRKTTPK